MADDDHTLRQTAEFHEHVQRMFTPLKPGLAYVRTAWYAANDFEEDFAEPDFMDVLTPALLERARSDGVMCIGWMEKEMRDTIETCALAYMRDPNIYGGQNFAWNAHDPEDMREALCTFCDQNISNWEEEHMHNYIASIAGDETLSEAERTALGQYVESFVGSALAAIPYHLQEGDEEIYYDTDDTNPSPQSPQ